MSGIDSAAAGPDWVSRNHPNAASAFKNGHPLWARVIVACLAGIATIAVALGVRLAISPWIGREAPYLFFSPVVLLVAWRLGTTAGIVALFAGYCAGDWFVTVPARISFGPYSAAEKALIADYIIAGITGVALLHILDRSRRRARALAREKSLEVEERRRAEQRLEAAREQLAAHATLLEQRVAERTADLQRSVDDMEELLYSIAHNLYAPNRAMLGFTHLLKSEHGAQLDAEAAEYVNRLADAAEKNSALITGLLEIGRWSHCPLTIRREPVDAIMAAAVDSFDEEIRERQAIVSVDTCSFEVETDRKAVDCALRHLISNALKFTSPGKAPIVRIRAASCDDFVCIHVEDRGIGIPEKYCERVFRAMETLHKDGVHPGVGAGLAVVRKIVERLNGRVSIQSELGHGTRVEMCLPMVRVEELTQGTRAAGFAQKQVDFQAV